MLLFFFPPVSLISNTFFVANKKIATVVDLRHRAGGYFNISGFLFENDKIGPVHAKPIKVHISNWKTTPNPSLKKKEKRKLSLSFIKDPSSLHCGYSS